MSKVREIPYLVALLKVFDIDFISPEESLQIQGLRVNEKDDVALAIRTLLLPSFLAYQPIERATMLSVLRSSLEDPYERFESVFDQLSLDFEDDLDDGRSFMQTVLIELERQAKVH